MQLSIIVLLVIIAIVLPAAVSKNQAHGFAIIRLSCNVTASKIRCTYFYLP
jgi:hypothetical protein